MKHIKGITRMDQPSTRTFGWFVRIGFVKTGDRYTALRTAFFGDKTYGGKRRALAAAKEVARYFRRSIGT